jgi:hypothetical protein
VVCVRKPFHKLLLHFFCIFASLLKHPFHQKHSSLKQQNHFHINTCSHPDIFSFKDTMIW